MKKERLLKSVYALLAVMLIISGAGCKSDSEKTAQSDAGSKNAEKPIELSFAGLMPAASPWEIKSNGSLTC